MEKPDLKIVPALDVLELDRARKLVEAVSDLKVVYGFKVGFPLALTYGIGRVVETLKEISDKPVIYDHQKGATDIPDTGDLFAEALLRGGINEAILFPQAGLKTLAAWVKALESREIKVIVGGIMTHAGYLASEGGFLLDSGVLSIYGKAAEMGVRAFVVPLTRVEVVRSINQSLRPFAPYEFYSPGFGAQGGKVEDIASIGKLNVIIGRSLLRAEDPASYICKLEEKWSHPA